ncbi:uncharacterized protein B0H18DRAFT_1115846 [Fomitopsis serialis]|uniref:uncharacterized protein n=1 Tax=Fomitopsis serialis TaxID=139415 RepID=UPI0020083448|nr:uncharacterized protein B0H18DRAFT_1115846 [Neoantrodia serialis]KAH9932618.1 hypothetical protein B0H18DRAFT_1115846 [Neoantrodia serialis]
MAQYSMVNGTVTFQTATDSWNTTVNTTGSELPRPRPRVVLRAKEKEDLWFSDATAMLIIAALTLLDLYATYFKLRWRLSRRPQAAQCDVPRPEPQPEPREPAE